MTMEAENEMESQLQLDIVIRRSAAVLELFAGEDEALTLVMVSEDSTSKVVVFP
jgi:hypothetical protein